MRTAAAFWLLAGAGLKGGLAPARGLPTGRFKWLGQITVGWQAVQAPAV